MKCNFEAEFPVNATLNFYFTYFIQVQLLLRCIILKETTHDQCRNYRDFF